MDELHRLASDVTRHYLSQNHEPAQEDSRLFEDLQQFALAALESVRSGEFARKEYLPQGEFVGYWPLALIDHGLSEGWRGHTQ